LSYKPSALVAKYLAYVAGGLALLFLGGLVRDYYRPQEIQGHRPPPVVAKETRKVEAAPRQEVQRTLSVPVLPPKKVEQLEQTYSLDLDETTLLTEVKIPPAPYGGTAVATLDGSGSVELVVAPAPRPFFELGGEWALGAGPSWHNGELGAKLRLARDLARVGPVHLRAEGSLDIVGGETELEAVLLGEVRFR
jgi:hypothetical protein